MFISKIPDSVSVLCMLCYYYLHLGNVFFQPCDGVLVASGITAHTILHFSHLAHQRLILKGETGLKRWS